MNRSWLFALTLLALALCPSQLHAGAAAATPVNCAAATVGKGELFLPDPIQASICSASQSCPGGGSISCSCPGTGQCTAGATSVTCDCTPNPDYYYECENECSPGQEMQVPDGCCSPYKGRFRWYICNSSGQWEWTPYFMCYGECDPLPPD